MFDWKGPFLPLCVGPFKVIIEKSGGGRFLWNRNRDLGWIWAGSATFEACFFFHVFMGNFFFKTL